MKILTLIVTLLITFTAIAQDKKIRVAVNESKPYVVFHRDHGKITRPTGITIDVLHYVFGENIEYVYCTSKEEVIDKVNHNEVEVGANVTLTPERLDLISAYSLPYIESHAAVLTQKPSQPGILKSFWIAMMNPDFLISWFQVFLVINLLAVTIGNKLYWIEYRRRRSDGKGFFSAWFTSLIAISFAAGLEGEPTRKSSKIILAYILIVYMTTFQPYITAYFTTKLVDAKVTAVKYDDMKKLQRVSVFTAKHTSNEAVLAEVGIEYSTSSIDSVISLICKDKAVYVHDKNILANYIFENALEDKVELSPIVIERTSRVLIYSRKFAPHKQKYDRILVHMKQIGKTEIMAKRYGIDPGVSQGFFIVKIVYGSISKTLTIDDLLIKYREQNRYKMSTAKHFAEKLLSIKALAISLQEPYTWASGWNSPVYCDNRKALSYPEVSNFITDNLVDIITKHFPDAQAISGVATAGIPWATSVANRLGLPLTYVRDKPKTHGMGNQVEGVITPGQKVVVIEDLVSTGKSSLTAVNTLKIAGADVIGMGGLFTYAFPTAIDAFAEAKVPLYTIGDYGALIEVAIEQNLVNADEQDILAQWRIDPANWGKQSA